MYNALLHPLGIAVQTDRISLFSNRLGGVECRYV